MTVNVVAPVAASAERENGVHRVPSLTDPGVEDISSLYCNVSVLFTCTNSFSVNTALT